MAATLPHSKPTSAPFQPLQDEFRVEFDEDVLAAAPSTGGVAATGGALEDDFESHAQQAQEELLQLRHKQRLIERRKEEFEEMSRKQVDFSRGRTEMQEKLSRSLVMLERESSEAQQKLEHFLYAKQELARHYEALKALQPEEWNRTDLLDQLSRALAVIEDGRADHERLMARLTPLLPQAKPEPQPPAPLAGFTKREFRYWLRCGFAFTLPVMVLGLIALLIFLIF